MSNYIGIFVEYELCHYSFHQFVAMPSITFSIFMEEVG